MKNDKSLYTFQLSCDMNLINSLIHDFINVNKYELQQKNGEEYYRAGDSIKGYMYFYYIISGQTLTIYAWLKGAFGNIPLENNTLNVLAMSYRNSLNILFQEIDKLNRGVVSMNNDVNNISNSVQMFNQNMNNSQNANQQQLGQNNVNQVTQTFSNETIKKQEKMCEIGFWLSLFGLLSSFFGVAYGLIIYILDFYFASQGLKTRKRGKAIATIILSIISLIIVVIQIISI